MQKNRSVTSEDNEASITSHTMPAGIGVRRPEDLSRARLRQRGTLRKWTIGKQPARRLPPEAHALWWGDVSLRAATRRICGTEALRGPRGPEARLLGDAASVARGIVPIHRLDATVGGGLADPAARSQLWRGVCVEIKSSRSHSHCAGPLTQMHKTEKGWASGGPYLKAGPDCQLRTDLGLCSPGCRPPGRASPRPSEAKMRPDNRTWCQRNKASREVMHQHRTRFEGTPRMQADMREHGALEAWGDVTLGTRSTACTTTDKETFAFKSFAKHTS